MLDVILMIVLKNGFCFYVMLGEGLEKVLLKERTEGRMSDIQVAVTEALPFVILLIGPALTLLTDSYMSRFHKMILLIVLSLAVTLLIQNVADSVLDHTPYLLARKLLSIYGYSIRPAVVVFFYYSRKRVGGRQPLSRYQRYRRARS